MNYKFAILFFIFLIPITASSQRSRIGETPIFNSNIQLVSFDGSQVLYKKDVLEIEKPLAVIFWLSTCKPCIKELNALNRLPDLVSVKDKATILVISDDSPQNYPAARAIAQKYNWNFELYFDKGYAVRNSLLLNWFGVPQVQVLDKNKKIVLHKFGYSRGNEKEILNTLKRHIKK